MLSTVGRTCLRRTIGVRHLSNVIQDHTNQWFEKSLPDTEKVESVLKPLAVEHLDTCEEGWKGAQFPDLSTKFKVLDSCIKGLGRDIPSSQLVYLQTIEDVITYYQTPVEEKRDSGSRNDMIDVLLLFYNTILLQAARIGHKGDFITAPELTPVFGEILAAWSLLHWQQAKYTTDIQFTELGPGRGTLMRDLIETVGIIGPAFLGRQPKLTANLVEISEQFVREQEKLLCGEGETRVTPTDIFEKEKYLARTGIHKCKFRWYSLLDHIPKSVPSIYIMNEFFDALPVHQFQKTADKGWVEIMVDCDADQDVLHYTTYRTGKAIALDHREDLLGAAAGTTFEYSPMSQRIIQTLSERISENGGAALIIDYGENELTSELTFRAFRDHQQVNPLEDLGLCDLTADVNFRDLSQSVGENITAYGPVQQGDFLTLMGIGERFKQMYSSVPEEKRDAVIHAVDFLCSTDQMGARFKVMCLARSSDPVPFCFES
eukprot:sb/3464202/